MRDETRMLLESMNRLFEDHCTKAVADGAETGTFPTALWQAVSETGVPLAALPESVGGADAEWSDLYAGTARCGALMPRRSRLPRRCWRRGSRRPPGSR